MSWRDRLRLALAPALAAATLAGCNVAPLYGPLAADPALQGRLQEIEVAPISERLGHYVRNELIFGLNGTGAEVAPRYRLTVTLKEQARTPIIDTVTGRATSATVVVEAAYKLVSLPDEKEVAQGVTSSIASYDRFSNRLANVRAARDAETRDAKTIADAIRTRISSALVGGT
ncbi:MAG TPA: LPS assembly lipoprotein LptE [Methylocystis sp.]|nr:LPS assembly lipoprotein LptE [Methylocystis sp.]